MKILSATLHPLLLPLAEPYTIAYCTFTEAPNIFLRLITNTKWVGLGAANPDPEVTGETTAQVEMALSTLLPELEGRSLSDDKFWESVRAKFIHKPSAYAALEMALFDLRAKEANLPLWKFLGAKWRPLPTYVTLGILPLKETISLAKEKVALGFRALKLKGGTSWEADVERIAKTREAIGPSIPLGFDANQGFSVETAISFAKATALYELTFLEQPCEKRSLASLEAIQLQTHLPILADESLLTLSDAEALGSKVRLFNLKLMKVGGIKAALDIAAVAKRNGVGTLTGCMDESALGISAGLQFALGAQSYDWCDLDGHLELMNDPTTAAVVLNDGRLLATEKPGLGIDDIQF